MAQVNSARQNLPPNHRLLAGQLLSLPRSVLCNYPTHGHKHPCCRGMVIVSWRWESLNVCTSIPRLINPNDILIIHHLNTTLLILLTHTTVLYVMLYFHVVPMSVFCFVFSTKTLNCFFIRAIDYLGHWIQRVWSLLRALETGILLKHIYFFK